MEQLLGKFDRVISTALLAVGMVFVTYQTIELFWLFGSWLFETISTQQFSLHQKGRPVAGLFFGILLTLEILESIKIFSKSHLVKIKIILLIGLIAVTRRILEMDVAHTNPMEDFSTAGLVLVLSVGYFLIGRTPVKED